MSEETGQNERRVTDQSDQVAVRELIGWFIGSVTGMYLGLALGHYLQASLILLSAGVFGWMAGGLAAVKVTTLIFHTPPDWTISSHLAMGLIFGFLIGCLVGAFVGFFTGLPELAASIVGSVFGLVAGWLAAPAIARRISVHKKANDPQPN